MVAAGRTSEKYRHARVPQLPVLGVDQIDARADNVLERSAGFSQRLGGNLEDAPRLAGGVALFGAGRGGSREIYGIAHAHRARKTDDGLEGDLPLMFLRMMCERRAAERAAAR